LVEELEEFRRKVCDAASFHVGIKESSRVV